MFVRAFVVNVVCVLRVALFMFGEDAARVCICCIGPSRFYVHVCVLDSDVTDHSFAGLFVCGCCTVHSLHNSLVMLFVLVMFIVCLFCVYVVCICEP